MLSLYLRRSFRRRPLRHLALFWVLMCSFLLPLVVSVYRDSYQYGYQMQLLDFSQGQAIHISGDIQPEDVEVLRGIDGLTEPYYQDRFIYMTFDSEEAWDRYSSPYNSTMLCAEIRSRLAKNGRKGSEVDISFYSYDSVNAVLNDPLTVSTLRRLLIESLVLSLFAGLIIQSAYRGHIAAFSPELTELAALGATKGQIIRMFLLELAILFPPAVGGAVGISCAVMRAIYKTFQEQMMKSGIVWNIFHIDFKNTALQIGFYLLVCLGSLGLALLKQSRKRPAKKGKRAASLPRLWAQQTRPPFVQCLLILIPLVTVFVVLFNQRLYRYSNALERAQSVEINILSPIKGFKQDELDFISSQTGIKRIETVQDFNANYALNTPNGEYQSVTVFRYQDIAPDEPDLEKYQFVSNFPEECESEGTYELYSLVYYQGKISLTLAKRLTPAKEYPERPDFYISNALMDELEANAPVIRVKVYTTQQYAAALEDTLRRNLPADYQFTSSWNDDLSIAAQDEGVLWLIGWIFCVLGLVAVQIVWVRLSSYVRECAPMLRTVYHLGASRRQLSRLIPAWQAAIPAAIVPFIIAVPYTWLSSLVRFGYRGTFIVSLPLLGIYGLIAAVAVLSFLLPVKFTMSLIQKEF